MNADCGIRERDVGHLITEAVYQFVQIHYIELLSVLPVTFLLTGLVFASGSTVICESGTNEG